MNARRAIACSTGALISIDKHIHVHIYIHTYIYTYTHAYRSSGPGVRDRVGGSVMAKEEEWYNSWYEPDGDGTLADDTLAASMLLGSLFIHIYIYTYIHIYIRL
jgi:hypothetical protein